jgi:holin-like protein
LLLLFVALSAHILPLEAVNETGNFLLSIMPLLFIAPAVKMLDVWDSVRSFLLPILVLIAISTLVTFAVSGGVVQALINRGRSGGTDD